MCNELRTLRCSALELRIGRSAGWDRATRFPGSNVPEMSRHIFLVLGGQVSAPKCTNNTPDTVSYA